MNHRHFENEDLFFGSLPLPVALCNRGGVSGGHFGQVPGAPRFRGPRRFFGPRGCLWPHVFRDRTARFWADIYMQRGAGESRFNIKYESRTFLRN